MKKVNKITTSSSQGKKMLGVRIDESLARLFKSNAARNGITTQELTIRLINEYLKREGELK